MNKTICSFAWDSVAVKPNGEVTPCCLFNHYLNKENDWGKLTDNLDFRNNDLWRDLRTRMIAGESIPECGRCYEEESRGLSSMRIANLHRLPDSPSVTAGKLTYLEMAFSNLCNLACVSCSVYCSSKWGTEDFKYNRLEGKSLVEHNVTIADLEHLTTLKIIGGEPLMEQKRFIELLGKLNLPNLTLMISTNGTVLPDAPLKKLLDQCKQLVIDVSIDGIDSVGEWYRWPTKFNTVKEVINQLDAWWSNDSRVTFNIKTLINIFNIWRLNEILAFVESNHKNWTMYFNWIAHPAWQQISNLPNLAKEELIKKLNSWNVNPTQLWHPNFNNPYETSIIKLKEEPVVEWKTIKEKTLELANERNLDIYTMIPELAPLLKEHP